MSEERKIISLSKEPVDKTESKEVKCRVMYPIGNYSNEEIFPNSNRPIDNAVSKIRVCTPVMKTDTDEIGEKYFKASEENINSLHGISEEPDKNEKSTKATISNEILDMVAKALDLMHTLDVEFDDDGKGCTYNGKHWELAKLQEIYNQKITKESFTNVPDDIKELAKYAFNVCTDDTFVAMKQGILIFNNKPYTYEEIEELANKKKEKEREEKLIKNILKVFNEKDLSNIERNEYGCAYIKDKNEYKDNIETAPLYLSYDNVNLLATKLDVDNLTKEKYSSMLNQMSELHNKPSSKFMYCVIDGKNEICIASKYDTSIIKNEREINKEYNHSLSIKRRKARKKFFVSSGKIMVKSIPIILVTCIVCGICFGVVNGLRKIDYDAISARSINSADRTRNEIVSLNEWYKTDKYYYFKVTDDENKNFTFRVTLKSDLEEDETFKSDTMTIVVASYDSYSYVDNTKNQNAETQYYIQGHTNHVLKNITFSKYNADKENAK